MPGAAEIRVHGIREMHRAFAATDKHLVGALREALEEVAEPIRRDAERLAVSEIRNMPASLRWGRMRVGVSTKNAVVYVAPVERGVKAGPRKRRNLAPLLMDRAMQPALDRHKDKVAAALDEALGDLFQRYTKWTTHG